jgi:gamma-glutamyl-gamma-aminobutyraldehyde dehydrogenase/4-guanidinobutyraldehyde dehydrogenase/NAD-dependent aldehyde dehydrogenase
MKQDKLLDRDWHEYARTLPLKTKAFIGGRYVDAASGETFSVRSPIDGKEICKVASSAEVDVDGAVSAARRSFESGSWSRASPRRRKKVMQNFAEAILAHVDELAAAETLDVGKPIKYSHRMDIPAAANAISWYGEAIDKVYGELAPVGNGALGMITREPLGVIGCVVPWNFPLLLTSWKIGAALAAGNSVVLKPAEQSPLSALMIAELALEVGIPEGVLNVVPGFGHLAGKALGLHNDVDAVAFTGSTEVGKLFLHYSAESNMKALQLECGGKSPQIVTDDVADLVPAARAIVQGAFFNQGQVCTAGSRVIVHQSKREELADLIAKQAVKMTPANPLDATTDLGCL